MDKSFMAFFGVIGGFLANIFGITDNFFITLVIMMICDYAMGIFTSFSGKSTKTKAGRFKSEICFKGLVKKLSYLIFVIVGHRLDIILDLNIVRTGVITAFISNEIFSIIENAILIGIPVPEIIKKTMEVLQKED